MGLGLGPGYVVCWEATVALGLGGALQGRGRRGLA